MQALIEGSSSTATFDPASTFLFTVSALAVVAAMFFNGEYKRTALEHAHAAANSNSQSSDTHQSQSTGQGVANNMDDYPVRTQIIGAIDSDISPVEVDSLKRKLIDSSTSSTQQISSSNNR